MPLFIFFVNKPLTMIPYVIGIIFFLGVNALNLDLFPLPFLFLLFSFSLWYPLFLVYTYILRDIQHEILEIQVSQFRKLFLNIVWLLGLAILLACVGIGYFQSSFGSLFFLLGFTVVSLISFQFMIEAKLISETFKRNASLKEFNFNDFYIEIRQLLLTKVIQK